MKPIAVLPFLLSILLTPLSLIASPGRKAMVDTAFRELPAIVNFLATSYEFNQQLSPEERAQLQGIQAITWSMDQKWVFTNQPQIEDKFPKIQYSSDPSLFKLNPDQPERSAVTTPTLADPIYFNLRYLDSNSTAPTYLDVIQILFHEMGHKIRGGENQQAVDSLSAKIVNFLKPYYQTADLDQVVKLEMLALPQDFRADSMGPRKDSWIIVHSQGMTEAHQIYLINERYNFEKYTGLGGNMHEVTSVRILNLSRAGDTIHPRQLSFRFQYDLEFKSKLVFMDPNVIMGGGAVAIGGMQPMITRQREIPITETLTSYVQGVSQMGLPRDQRDNPQFLGVTLSGQGYQDMSGFNRVLSVQKKDGQILVQVSNSDQIHKIYLRAKSDENNEDEYLISGEKISSPKGDQFRFLIPADLRSKSGLILLTDLILNGEGRIPLPETIRYRSTQSRSQKPLDLVQLTFFDGVNWQSKQSDRITRLPEGPVRFRIQVDSDEVISQVRLTWNKGASLLWGNQTESFGMYAVLEEEVINNLKLVEKTKDGQSVYEFISQEALQIHLPKTKDPIRAVDSGRRFLNSAIVSTKGLQSRALTYRTDQKIYTGEYLQVKQRSAVSQALACSRVHASP